MCKVSLKSYMRTSLGANWPLFSGIMNFRISSGKIGRTGKKFWKLSELPDVMTTYKESQLLMKEINAYLSKVIMPPIICLIVSIFILMGYNTFRLYRSTPLVAFIFYPLTAIFVGITGLVVGKKCQEIYDCSKSLLGNLQKIISLRHSVRKVEKLKLSKNLRALQPFGVSVGSYFILRNGFLQNVTVFSIGQVINLLISGTLL